MNTQTTTYTVQIQASNSDQTIWQALHPAENVEADETTTLDLIAEDVADDQNIAEGGDWRVCVWAGADADTGTEPDYIYDATADDKILGRIADAADAVRQAQDIVSQREAARDELIREAMRSGVRVGKVAAAAELSEPRLWQIRRGTRI